MSIFSHKKKTKQNKTKREREKRGKVCTGGRNPTSKLGMTESMRGNLRSGVPFVFVGSGKERLIQLLDYSSVASPQSGLFSDWSRNKRVLRTKP